MEFVVAIVIIIVSVLVGCAYFLWPPMGICFLTVIVLLLGVTVRERKESK